MEQNGLDRHGGEAEADVLNRLQRQFVERLGLDKIPRPAYRQQLLRVPDFLKQVLAARSRPVTSSCPDQSPLSAVALSPSLGKFTKLMFIALLPPTKSLCFCHGLSICLTVCSVTLKVTNGFYRIWLHRHTTGVVN